MKSFHFLWDLSRSCLVAASKRMKATSAPTTENTFSQFNCVQYKSCSCATSVSKHQPSGSRKCTIKKIFSIGGKRDMSLKNMTSFTIEASRLIVIQKVDIITIYNLNYNSSDWQLVSSSAEYLSRYMKYKSAHITYAMRVLYVSEKSAQSSKNQHNRAMMIIIIIIIITFQWMNNNEFFWETFYQFYPSIKWNSSRIISLNTRNEVFNLSSLHFSFPIQGPKDREEEKWRQSSKINNQ